MQHKVIVIGDAARAALIRGAKVVSDAAKITLGPAGQNFLLQKKNRVTNDGVSIAREITLRDEIENLGASKMKEIAIKANDEGGDGTTTAMVLGAAILDEGVKLLPSGVVAGKKTPFQVINQIEDERVAVTARLAEMATPVETVEDLIKVATVSVEDEELGKLIGAAQWELGPDGHLLAEETNETHCSIERINGIRLDNGYGSSAIINNQEKEALEMEDVRVIYTNNTVHGVEPLKDVLDSLIAMGHKKVIVMARAFTNEAIGEFLQNINNGFLLYPLNAPYTDQVEVMKDLEALLGGRFINAEEGDLRSIQVSDVGFAKRVFAKRFTTVFTGPDDDYTKARIEKRVEELKEKEKGSESDFEKKNLGRRMAQLRDGFGLVKVGALSDTERKYKYDKAEDAVNAVRAALQEGTIPGAGQALKTISEEMPDGSILKPALLAPYLQIMKSTGNADIPEWVRDPVKVVRISLKQACSVAATFATAGGAISDEFPKPTCCAQSGQPSGGVE